jgi:hypothetical protein
MSVHSSHGNADSAVCPACGKIVIGAGSFFQSYLYHAHCVPRMSASTTSSSSSRAQSTGAAMQLFRFNEQFCSAGAAAPALQMQHLLNLPAQDPYSFKVEEHVLAEQPRKRRLVIKVVMAEGDQVRELSVPAKGVRVGYLYEKCGYSLEDYNVEISHENRLLLDRNQELHVDEGALFKVAAMKKPEVTVRCEDCHELLSLAEYQQHQCEQRRRPATPENSDAIPCENCGNLIPITFFLQHEKHCHQ